MSQALVATAMIGERRFPPLVPCRDRHDRWHWGTDDELTVVMIDIDPDELDRHENGTIDVTRDAAV